MSPARRDEAASSLRSALADSLLPATAVLRNKSRPSTAQFPPQPHIAGARATIQQRTMQRGDRSAWWSAPASSTSRDGQIRWSCLRSWPLHSHHRRRQLWQSQEYHNGRAKSKQVSIHAHRVFFFRRLNSVLATVSVVAPTDSTLRGARAGAWNDRGGRSRMGTTREITTPPSSTRAPAMVSALSFGRCAPPASR